MAETDEQIVDATPEDDGEDDAYALNRKAVAAILYAVDIDDRDKLTEALWNHAQHCLNIYANKTSKPSNKASTARCCR